MRDLLNDLDAGRFLSDADPMRRAQAGMKTPLPSRFYREALAGEADGAWRVLLDGRPVRTPAGTVLDLPTQALAGLVAAEYEAQAERIDPVTMPVTRLANTTADGVSADPQAVLEDILRYASSDLVCYRAEGPERLVERQAGSWDPVVDWARFALGARLYLAEGVMHVAQPPEAVAAIGAHLGRNADPYRLAALHVMTTIAGSALIALAVEAGEIDAEAGWDAAHVDEDWNIAQWGEDAEASARRQARRRDFMAAVAVLGAIRPLEA